MTEPASLARSLLEEGRVEVVVGYRPGTLPLRARPHFAFSPEQAAQFIWDRTCTPDLTVYLPRLKGRRVAVFVKGCDARSLVVLLQERQLSREQLVVIGLECPGVVTPDKLPPEQYQALTSATVEGEQVLLRGGSQLERVPVEQLLADPCRTCQHPDPVIQDYLIPTNCGRREREDPYGVVAQFERLEREERWVRLEREVADCIGCYACRQACPLCYCPDCFTDRFQPRWVGPIWSTSDALFFHLARALHLAGRCVDCGACVRACPLGIDLRHVYKRLEQAVKERFGYVPGLDPEAPPVLGTFRPEDPGDFIK